MEPEPNSKNRVGLFDVRPGEWTEILLTATPLFLALFTFWIFKSLKRGLFLSYYKAHPFTLFGWTLSGAETEQLAKVANVGGAYLLMLLLAWLGYRFKRRDVALGITGVVTLLTACFAFVADAPSAGMVWAFYLFSDLSNATSLVLFWAFVNDALGKEGGFQLIFRTRYLLLIALLVLVLNIVNSTGEYVLSKFVVEETTRRALSGAEKARFIGAFYSDFFWWVNVVSFAFQTLLVSRLFKWIGVGGALFILPLVALLGYSALLVLPLLPIVRVMKIVDNATDYSIQSTTRQALFLPTSREAKYKAKAAIDTFFWRAGDVLQAGLVLFGVTLGFGVSAFSAFNLALVFFWLGLAALIFFEHRKLSPPEKAAITQ